MAIWNYRAELIPKSWILSEYGEIPATLYKEETIDQVENLEAFFDEEFSH